MVVVVFAVVVVADNSYMKVQFHWSTQTQLFCTSVGLSLLTLLTPIWNSDYFSLSDFDDI